MSDDCTEPNRAACPRLCQDFCNKAEEAKSELSETMNEQPTPETDAIKVAFETMSDWLSAMKPFTDSEVLQERFRLILEESKSASKLARELDDARQNIKEAQLAPWTGKELHKIWSASCGASSFKFLPPWEQQHPHLQARWHALAEALNNGAQPNAA